MRDLISRRAAIDVTWEEPSYTDALNILTEVRDKIRALPTVVEPQMDLIDTTGLDEQIRCEICKNPMHTDRGCDGNCKYDEKLYEKITQILDKRITPLPSAQPEPQWIPVSERLPDDLGDYLVSIKRIGWNMEEYVENDIAYWDDLEGFHKADEVLAWMPLPEPYRAERRTDEGD